MNDLRQHAAAWHELHKVFNEVGNDPKGAALSLLFSMDQMLDSMDRLLDLGLDVSDLRNPTVVPIAAERRPRTEREARKIEAEIKSLTNLYMLWFPVTGAGAHVIYSEVGKDSLAEVLYRFLRAWYGEAAKEEVSSLVSKSSLNWLAFACALWLIEPVGEIKEQAPRINSAAWGRMRHAFEVRTLGTSALYLRKGSRAEYTSAAKSLAGWASSNISLGGQVGTRLRKALGENLSPKDQYERLLQELPGAMLEAWNARLAGEPLRSTGNRDTNLVSRIDTLIGKTAKSEREAELAETLSNDENDELLQDFELREDATRQLNALEEAAGLSPQQTKIWRCLRAGKEVQEIAVELRISRNQVDVQKSNAVGKLKKAAGL